MNSPHHPVPILKPASQSIPFSKSAPRGFALPAVLIIVVGMLILAVALLLITGIERSTARSFVDFERAGLAVRAGLEEVEAAMARETASDGFVVIGGNRDQALRQDRLAAPYLYVARPDLEGGSGDLRYEPLFSHREKPPGGSRLAAPSPDSLTDSGAGGFIDFTTLPYQEPVRAAWTYLTDESGRNVARYAYWVEDMQGRLDASMAGNVDGPGGAHARAAFPFPAPGVPAGDNAADLPTVSSAALYAIDPDAGADAQSALARTLIDNRPLMISPGSLLAAAGAQAPLARETQSGRLADPALRTVEESLAATNVPYFERPEIPFADGIDARAVGLPKLNLNAMLAEEPDSAVQQMARHIDEALPDFDRRKGGFPENYLKTLAANALGYATDSNRPIVLPGEYRGVGAYPQVSEFLIRYRWERIFREDGRTIVELSATTYAELWNMNNVPVRGQAQLTYETNASFPLMAIPEINLSDLEDAEHELEFTDGLYWFPPLKMDRADSGASGDGDGNFEFMFTLEPNEYYLFNCGTVTYQFDVGNASVFVPSPLVLEGEVFGQGNVGYRLRWNGQIVDQAAGGVHRNSSSLNFPTDTANQPRQRIRTTVPGHSHTRSGAFVNNMGDPRMAWYLQAPQDANAYPINFSPFRRNIRRGSIYDSDPATKPRVYGRVLPSEWPDGGHNSPYSRGTPFTTTDQRVNPDDPRWRGNASGAGDTLPQLIPDDSPQRLSRLGRFFSATELGHVYDPIMWQPTFENTAQTTEIRRGFMPSGLDRWPDVQPNSPPSSDYGGGNTLRIGRPEHPAFDQTGDRSRHAIRLLDLFHAGIPHSEAREEREGPLVRIDGHVNLNTASRDALRALAAGPIEQDPRIGRRPSLNHLTTNFFAPRTLPLQLQAPQNQQLADRVADAIIAARPFASAADAVFARTPNGEYVFGNRAQFEENETIQWSDAAAEELFARVYNNATVRSRNFRVWVVGQSLAPSAAGVADPEVLAESRRAFTIHADPGERAADGSIVPNNSRIQILHESDF